VEAVPGVFVSPGGMEVIEQRHGNLLCRKPGNRLLFGSI
jgi:hypothetical protein